MFCLPTFLAHENSTLKPENKTSMTFNIDNKESKEKNNLTACYCCRINESEFQEVLQLMYKPTTTTVEIQVSVLSDNETRHFPKMTWHWAREIGRTVIVSIARAEETMFASPIFTLILKVGIGKVNIQIREESERCLPSGKNGSDIVFDFLLRQLFSQSKEDHFYRLCQARDDKRTIYTTYKCCQITGVRNLPICADYLSPVVEFALPVVIAVFLISLYLVVPFALEHMITYKTIKFYKTSDSPMSLISIVSKILFEGCGPEKSLFRRSVFAVLSLLVFIPNFYGFSSLQWIFICWGILFVFFYDTQMTGEKAKEECVENLCQETCRNGNEQECAQKCIKKCEDTCDRTQFDEDIITCFRVPFLLPFFFLKEKRIEFKPGRNTFLHHLVYNVSVFFYSLLVLIAMLLYFFLLFPIIIALNLLLFALVGVTIPFVWPRHCHVNALQKWLFPLRFVTLCFIVFFTGMIFLFALSIVVGMFLNAEYFHPFVAPILTVMVYFWRNWKSSIEEKCLQLKTIIIEVCKKKADANKNRKSAVKPGARVKTGDEDEASCSEIVHDLCFLWIRIKDYCLSCKKKVSGKGRNRDETLILTHVGVDNSASGEIDSDNTPRQNIENNEDKNDGREDDKLIIKFNKYGEAEISKELYERISKEILHTENLLFYFIRRVIFVAIYAFVMQVLMLLGRESGISSSVQIISAIATAVIPFIYDTIFADPDMALKDSKNEATKEKLEKILRVYKRENSDTIYVVLITVDKGHYEGHDNKESDSAKTSNDGISTISS